MKTKKQECDHIIAFHIGHLTISKSESTPERLNDDCCGGVMKLKFCPLCGEKNDLT